MTPLMYAASASDNPVCLEIAQELLKRAGELDKVETLMEAQDNEGDTPLIIAIKTGGLEFVSLLLENNANVNIINSQGQTAIWWAAKNGDVKIAERLISKNPKLNLECHGEDDDGTVYTPLLIASKYNHTELVNLLMKANADPNAADKAPPRLVFWKLLWKTFFSNLLAFF